MKNFNYIARDKSGVIKKGSIQATDRSVVLHELRIKGMAPVSVQDQYFLKKIRRPLVCLNRIHYFFIGSGICVVIFLLVLTKEQRNMKEPLRDDVHQKILKSRTSQLKTNNFQTNIVAANEKGYLQSVSLTNQYTQIIESQDNFVTNRKIIIRNILPDGAISNVTPQSAFSTSAERALNVIANTQPGMPIPPLLVMPTGQDFINALNKEIVVYDNDSNATIDKKANVARVKEALKEYMEQGGKPDEFLSFYRKELHKMFNERRLASIELSRISKEEGVVAAEKFIEAKNKSFSERGIKILQLPLSN